MPTGRWWTPPEDIKLRELWDEGVLIKIIADRLDRTPSGVRERVHRLGLPRRLPIKPLNCQVRIYLQPAEVRAVKQLASRRGIHVTQLIRNLLKKELANAPDPS